MTDKRHRHTFRSEAYTTERLTELAEARACDSVSEYIRLLLRHDEAYLVTEGYVPDPVGRTVEVETP